jgi:EAL domain-containing protein (putative c-di-GMP-specific phosphodiesterase class I)
VETENQAEILREWGCDQVQGFFYGTPDAELPQPEETVGRPLVA